MRFPRARGAAGTIGTDWLKIIVHFADVLKDLAPRLRIRNLWVVGAYTFQEASFLFTVFSSLEKVCLFEPLPEIASDLKRRFYNDEKVTVFCCALADFVATAPFHVTNNLASSSLLELSRHREIFPQVRVTCEIHVSVRTIEDVLAKEAIAPPDFLLMDVQGAELSVLKGTPQEVLSGHEHKYDDVRGKGFFGQTRRERRAYPKVDL